MTRDEKVDLSFLLLKIFMIICLCVFGFLALKKVTVESLAQLIENARPAQSAETGIIESVTSIVVPGIFSDSIAQEVTVNGTKYTLPSTFRYKFKTGQKVEFEYYIDSKNINLIKEAS